MLQPYGLRRIGRIDHNGQPCLLQQQGGPQGGQHRHLIFLPYFSSDFFSKVKISDVYGGQCGHHGELELTRRQEGLHNFPSQS